MKIIAQPRIGPRCRRGPTGPVLQQRPAASTPLAHQRTPHGCGSQLLRAAPFTPTDPRTGVRRNMETDEKTDIPDHHHRTDRLDRRRYDLDAQLPEQPTAATPGPNTLPDGSPVSRTDGSTVSSSGTGGPQRRQYPRNDPSARGTAQARPAGVRMDTAGAWSRQIGLALLGLVVLLATVNSGVCNSRPPTSATAKGATCPWEQSATTTTTEPSMDCYRAWAVRTTGISGSKAIWSTTWKTDGPLRIVVLSGPARPDQDDLASVASTATELWADALGANTRDLLVVDGAETHIGQAAVLTNGAALISRRLKTGDARRWAVAHEAAHLWWRTGTPWVDEGMAEVTARLTTRGPEPVELRTSCPWATLGQWLSEAPDGADLNCATHLGAQALWQLHQTNEDTFWALAQALASDDSAQRTVAALTLIVETSRSTHQAGSPAQQTADSTQRRRP